MTHVTKPTSQIRVRFAPSPTGELHIGGARTALFNYLFAQKTKGKFLLRIEDTDRQRFVPGASERIIDSLLWLGLRFDAKPIVQSERLPIYQKAAQALIKKDLAYLCFCSKERLEDLRKEQEAKKEPPKYDGLCRRLSSSEVKKRLKEEKNYVIRLKVPQEGSIKFNDLIRGEIEFQLVEIDDSIILKSDGFPTYYLASVVDDNEMEISHVIRGEEWLSSTPKNILIFKAFSWPIPKYAHLPLTLNPDRTKLSKRFGAVSIPEFREKGYLPEALINFMVFLGWNPKHEGEIFSLKELVKEFSLEGIGRSAAIFDLNKLNWYQGYYFKKVASENPESLIREFKEKYKIKISKEEMKKIFKVFIIGGRIRFLGEIPQKHPYLFREPKYTSSLLIFQKSTKEKTKKGLELGLKNLGQVKEKDWKVDFLHNVLKTLSQTSHLNFGDVFWPIRVALSGQEASPSPEELLWIFGKEESLLRIKKALSRLR